MTGGCQRRINDARVSDPKMKAIGTDEYPRRQIGHNVEREGKQDGGRAALQPPNPLAKAGGQFAVSDQVGQRADDIRIGDHDGSEVALFPAGRDSDNGPLVAEESALRQSAEAHARHFPRPPSAATRQGAASRRPGNGLLRSDSRTRRHIAHRNALRQVGDVFGYGGEELPQALVGDEPVQHLTIGPEQPQDDMRAPDLQCRKGLGCGRRIGDPTGIIHFSVKIPMDGAHLGEETRYAGNFMGEQVAQPGD